MENKLSQSKERIIDVGGGTGEYLLRLAKENPDKQYLILEPKDIDIKDKPTNLHIVKWRSDIDSAFPLAPDSIDEANISFLMGEIQYKTKAIETIEVSKSKFRKILKDLKSVLKDGAIVTIVDAKFNITYIEEMLWEEGFTLLNKPESIRDPDKSFWSKYFYNLARTSKRKYEPDDMPDATPMEIRAQLIK